MMISLLIYCVEPTDRAADAARYVNRMILDRILTSDEETAIETLTAIGGRDDLYMEDIIEGLFYQYTASRIGERYLEILLASVMDGRSEAGLEMWLLANGDAFELLARNLGGFTNPYLRANILALLPRIDRADTPSLLMMEGSRLLSELKAQKGYLGAAQLRELAVFFEIVARLGDRSFSELCLSIVEISRQRTAVAAGRELLRQLESGRD